MVITRKSGFVVICAALLLTGCVSDVCKKHGLTSYKCTRLEDSIAYIKEHEEELVELTKTYNSTGLGFPLSESDIIGYKQTFCKKYQDKKFEFKSAEQVAFKLGPYMQHRFCYYLSSIEKPIMIAAPKEMTDEGGRVFYYLIDQNRVVDFDVHNVVYSKNGFKYGSY